MKKQLLALSVIASSLVTAQTQSPDWINLQNSNFPATSAGVKHLDAVDVNVIWATGYNGMAPSENYNWFSVSSDGGNNFSSGNVYSDTDIYVMASLEGIDATTAYLTAYEKAGGNLGAVHKTMDAGVTWTNVCSATMYTNAASFANITVFTDAMNGITMGDPVGGEFEIHQTNDAALTWTPVPGANIPNPQAGEYGLTDVYTKLGNHIWFGTNKGRAYHSTDAGTTWTVGAMTGAAQGVSRLAFTDPLNGMAYAYAGTASVPVFRIYKTANGGNTWAQVTNTVNAGTADICAIPGTNMFASSGSGTNNTVLAYTSDMGTTWTDWGSVGIQYLKIDFVNDTTGWAGTFSDQSIVGSGGMYKYSGLNVATSLKPLAEKATFSMMPNPTNGVVNFTLPTAKNGLTINVIDALGKTVYTDAVKSSHVGDNKQLNLEALPKGLYTISVNNGSEQSFSKLVVQ